MTPKKILDVRFSVTRRREGTKADEQIAEKLYQRGILSYPRTETDQYDKAFDFNSLIQKQTYSNEWGDFATRSAAMATLFRLTVSRS